MPVIRIPQIETAARNAAAEAARLELVAGIDDWYYKELPYILELRGSGAAASKLSKINPGGSVVFALPMSPQQYSIRRVMRQSVTPTMGGLIAEEDGLLWVEIRVAGTFGLRPKVISKGIDTTSFPDPPATALSGPGWTQRMLHNIFDRYAQLKADPRIAHLVTLIWHDMRAGDHWVCVPEQVDVPRSVDRRAQHPYTFVLRGIAPASSEVNTGTQATVKGFSDFRNAILKVQQAATQIKAAIADADRYVQELRFYVAEVDNVYNEINQIANAATDFVEGATGFITLGRGFIDTTARNLQAVLETMETVTEVPEAVRHNFALALDGIDAVLAQYKAFGERFSKKQEDQAAVDAGAASDSTTTLESAKTAGSARTLTAASSRRARVNDQELVDSGALSSARLIGKYTGTKEYAVRSIDSITSIAARELGDGALWYDIAVLNGLKHPYISAARAPGTVRPGDVIVIPTTAPENLTAVASLKPDLESILGTDIDLIEDSNSFPGRPVVDLRIDPRTNRDVALARGLDCYKVGLQLRMWTERGKMPLIPEYGRPRVVGAKGTDEFLTLLRLTTRQTVLQDSRTEAIGTMRFTASGDQVEIEMDVIPIGSSNTQSVTLSPV